MLNSKPREKGPGFKPVVCCKQYNHLAEVKTEEQILLFIWEEKNILLSQIPSFCGLLNVT